MFMPFKGVPALGNSVLIITELFVGEVNTDHVFFFFFLEHFLYFCCYSPRGLTTLHHDAKGPFEVLKDVSLSSYDKKMRRTL